jgi:hypothetical protein
MDMLDRANNGFRGRKQFRSKLPMRYDYTSDLVHKLVLANYF